MAVLERGGNAFDAAVAAGFALQVVEPHMNGPGGDLPLLLWDGSRVRVICGQGPAPAAATIDALPRRSGMDLVPGTGPYAACVPGAFDAWMHAAARLRDVGARGRARVRDRLRARRVPAPRRGSCSAIARIEPDVGRSPPRSGSRWTGGCATRCWPTPTSGSPPCPGASREARIDAARDAWYRGWVAEALASGLPHARTTWRRFAATIEEPVSLRFGDWTVFKTGPWGQGPVFLQQLALLDELGPFLGVEHVHTVLEGAKLAFADREAWYGDSAPVPLELLLSREYADARRALIGARGFAASCGPGPDAAATRRCAAGRGRRRGEPTRGDTCHLDVADRFGNLVSATPSGGWLQCSPAIDGLGFCLGTRAQMFWLEEGLPSSLVAGRRPRTTLSPSHGGRTTTAPCWRSARPGGDQQDQWSLEFFLAHAVFGLDLQEAIDAPMFHTDHFPSSFYPREAAPRRGRGRGRGCRRRRWRRCGRAGTT